MEPSFFSAWAQYLREVGRASRSMLKAAGTVVPYFLGVGENRKQVTEHYPDPVSARTEEDRPPRTRGMLYNDINRCTGCLKCRDVCPAHCIEIEVEPGPDSLKPWVAVFDIDVSKCVVCGLCTEVCEPTSLVHTKKLDGANYGLDDLITSFGRGSVSREQREKWQTLRGAEAPRT